MPLVFKQLESASAIERVTAVERVQTSNHTRMSSYELDTFVVGDPTGGTLGVIRRSEGFAFERGGICIQIPGTCLVPGSGLCAGNKQERDSSGPHALGIQGLGGKVQYKSIKSPIVSVMKAARHGVENEGLVGAARLEWPRRASCAGGIYADVRGRERHPEGRSSTENQ